MTHGRSERHYPALVITWPDGAPVPEDDADRLIAELQDTGPTAVEHTAGQTLVYYSDAEACARGVARLGEVAPSLQVVTRWISDEAWAERSQAALGFVQVGTRLLVTPPWLAREAAQAHPDALVVVIQPSMGFGTGHHQTTRLCLELLTRQTVAGASVLDVGTGSGVLAITAARLGARRVAAIDADADALEAAGENVALNDATEAVDLRVAEAGEYLAASVSGFDLVLANLTGAVLERLARPLVAAARPGGTIVVSGLLRGEQPSVEASLAAAGALLREAVAEDEWAALRFERSGPPPAQP